MSFIRPRARWHRPQHAALHGVWCGEGCLTGTVRSRAKFVSPMSDCAWAPFGGAVLPQSKLRRICSGRAWKRAFLHVCSPRSYSDVDLTERTVLGARSLVSCMYTETSGLSFCGSDRNRSMLPLPVWFVQRAPGWEPGGLCRDGSSDSGCGGLYHRVCTVEVLFYFFKVSEQTEAECPDPVRPCAVLIVRWHGVLSEPGERGQLREVRALGGSPGTPLTGHPTQSLCPVPSSCPLHGCRGAPRDAQP